MHFVLTAYDATDDEVLERRKSVRDEHLAYVQELKAAGKIIMGMALLDDDEQMCGSLMVFDFPDEAALLECIENDPYTAGGVWDECTVTRVTVPPLFLESR